MKAKIKIMVAEDHELVRKGFISLIQELKNAEVIDEAANGKELLNKLKIKIPDLILMDYRMPIMDGREAMQIVKAKYPEVKVIMMSVHDDNDLILDLVAKGANSFISKAATSENLYNSIIRTYNEGHFFDSKISQLLVNGIISQRGSSDKIKKETLSDREVTVLREICNGSTNKAISERLYISSSTVNFHKMNIYKKTNCNKVVDLVRYAYKNGFIRV
ncbi:MAG: response regulator [Sphingobacteriaceae bacterium]|jgi:two-component system response regulator DegU